MKKLTSWIVVVFALAIASMLGIHWKQVQETEVGWEYKDRQTERREVAKSLVLALEQYRAASANFRRIPEREVVAAKTRIRAELNDGITALEKLDADTDRKTLDILRGQSNEFLVLAAKLEPQYYSRNVYQNPEFQKLHDSMLGNLDVVAQNAKALSQTSLTQLDKSKARSMTLLAAAALLAVLMLGMLLLHTYFRLTRPLSAMRERIQALRTQGARAPKSKPLPGVYGEAEKTISDLVTTVEMHQQDRQRFINAIITDLRPALTGLQAGGNTLLVMHDRAEPKHRLNAQEMVRRALFRISGVLDDLTDLLDEDFTRIRLNEKLVDLGDILTQMGRMLGGPGSPYQIEVSVPPIPVWASLDPQRIERVLINLASKQMLFQPQGGRIRFTMGDPAQDPTDGIEISIYSETEGAASGAATDGAASGPEQDLLRHWASQSGFGMSLAYKVARAHGGTITAAGVAGMRVLFTLKLPKERIATGILGTGARTRLLGETSKMTIDH